jgi:hypothetical protein
LPFWFNTRETVAVETPAVSAMSRSVFPDIKPPSLQNLSQV